MNKNHMPNCKGWGICEHNKERERCKNCKVWGICKNSKLINMYLERRRKNRETCPTMWDAYDAWSKQIHKYSE